MPRPPARCAARSTKDAYSRPGRCTAPGRAAGTRNTENHRPKPTHLPLSRYMPTRRVRCRLRAPRGNAMGVSAGVSWRGNPAAGDLDVFDAQGWLVPGGAQRVQDLADLAVDVLRFGVFPVGLDPCLDDCLFRRGAEPGGVQLGHGDTVVMGLAGCDGHLKLCLDVVGGRRLQRPVSIV